MSRLPILDPATSRIWNEAVQRPGRARTPEELHELLVGDQGLAGWPSDKPAREILLESLQRRRAASPPLKGASMLRYRSGPTDLRKVRVASETVIQPGELLFLDEQEHTVKPAYLFPWHVGGLASTLMGFAEKFMGVAWQSSAAGEMNPISVDLSPFAIYEFAAIRAEYEIGDLLVPAHARQAVPSDVAQQGLLANMLTAWRDEPRAAAIGRAAEYVRAQDEKSYIRVTFASAFHTASANARLHT